MREQHTTRPSDGKIGAEPSRMAVFVLLFATGNTLRRLGSYRSHFYFMAICANNVFAAALERCLPVERHSD